MIKEIKLEKIEGNPWQTRLAIDEDYIKDLAEDIARNGLLQVPVGRLVDEDGEPQPAAGRLKASARIQLAFGHNRLAAYSHNSAEKMPVDLQDLTNEQMATFAWAENEKRQDVTPIERARAIKRRMDDFGWKQAEAASHLGMSRPAVANVLRLLKLPDEIQDKIQDGELSERQAMAALPLISLPAEVKERAEGNYYNSPTSIMEKVLDGESSENIRWCVDRLKENNTRNLARAPWPMEHIFKASEVRAESCDQCPARLKGDKSRCTDFDCYDLKDTIWFREKLERASRATGIPVMSDEDRDGGMDALHGYDADLIKQVQEKGCSNLRLRIGSYYRSLIELGITQDDDISLWCANGHKGCQCLPQLQADKDKNDPEILAEKEASREIDKIVDAAAKQLAEAIADGQVDVWRWMMGFITWQLQGKGHDWDLDQIQYGISRALIKNIYHGSDPVQIKYSIDKILASIGVIYSAPADDLAADINRRWHRIKGWSDKLSEEVPTVSQVHGNMQNLANIVQDLGMAEDDELQLDFTGEQLDDLMLRLGELADVLEDSWWQVLDQAKMEQFGQVQEIVTADVNGDFEELLSQMPGQILAYSYAIVSGAEGHGIRAGKIRNMLNSVEVAA